MSATTTTKDAQTWVWPPPGAATPPIAATSNFGPINRQDSIVLDWAPATQPEIHLTCFAESEANSDGFVARLAKPPVTYQFTNKAEQDDAQDLVFCHFYFTPSIMGNTVTFQFNNTPAQKPVTWSGGSSATSTSSSSSSATSKPTKTQSSSPPPPTASSDNSGLSSGAKAGIGVGAVVVVLAVLALLGFFLFRRRRASGTLAPPETHDKQGDYEAVPHVVYEKRMETPPAELPSNTARYELPARSEPSSG